MQKRLRGATPHPKSKVRSGSREKILHVEIPHFPKSMVRNSSSEEIPHIQGKEQQLCFAGAAVKRYPTSKLRNPSKTVGAERGHQRQTD